MNKIRTLEECKKKQTKSRVSYGFLKIVSLSYHWCSRSSLNDCLLGLD